MKGLLLIFFLMASTSSWGRVSQVSLNFEEEVKLTPIVMDKLLFDGLLNLYKEFQEEDETLMAKKSHGDRLRSKLQSTARYMRF